MIPLCFLFNPALIESIAGSLYDICVNFLIRKEMILILSSIQFNRIKRTGLSFNVNKWLKPIKEKYNL